MNYKNPNKRQRNRKLTEKEFQEIVSRAFSPDLPEPKFSAKYYQHRQELERKVAMKDSKKSKKIYRAERTGKAGFALMTACVMGITGLAVYSGIGIYNVGRTINSVDSVQQETQPDFAVGAEVQVNTPDAPDTPDAPELPIKLAEDSRYTEYPEDLYNFQVKFQCEETDYTANGGYYGVMWNWVPDGLEFREDGPYGMKYHNYQDETDEHAITPDCVYQVRNSSMQFFENVNFTESVFEATLDKDLYPEIKNEKHMFCVRRGQGFDRLYVHFTGTPYVLTCFINGFTDEEVERFVENMTLVESEYVPIMFENEPSDFRCFLEENDYTLNGGVYALQVNWMPENSQFLTADQEADETSYTEGTKIAQQNYFGRVLGTPDDLCQLAGIPKDVEENVFECVFDTESDITKHMLWVPEENTEECRKSYLLVCFEGTPYYAEYGLLDFDRDDAEKFVEGMTLVETDTESAELYSAEQENASIQEVPKLVPVSEIDEMNTVSVGDVIAIPDSDIELQIQSASLQSDFTGITTDVIGLSKNYDQYLDENGEIHVVRMKENEDGSVERETIQQYILKLDVTLTKTGTSSANIEDGMTFNMEYFSLDDGKIRTNSHDANDMRVTREPKLCSEDGFFSFYTACDHQKNDIYDLKAGESADVTVYYAIDEDMADSIYITILDGALGLYDPEKYISSGYPVLDLSGLLSEQNSISN
ncbi:MAG: hypothetical protein K2H82_05395 [Oscillospiraceae bacterium]|nr:hypothetical protein [Oscillospiraceae bacterium]